MKKIYLWRRVLSILHQVIKRTFNFYVQARIKNKICEIDNAVTSETLSNILGVILKKSYDLITPSAPLSKNLSFKEKALLSLKECEKEKERLKTTINKIIEISSQENMIRKDISYPGKEVILHLILMTLTLGTNLNHPSLNHYNLNYFGLKQEYSEDTIKEIGTDLSKKLYSIGFDSMQLKDFFIKTLRSEPWKNIYCIYDTPLKLAKALDLDVQEIILIIGGSQKVLLGKLKSPSHNVGALNNL